jgi:hypothetical protein
MAVKKLTQSSLLNDKKYQSLLAGNAYFQPTAYESIATVTVGAGGQSSVTFSSIPSTFTHLQIRAMIKRSGGTGGDNTNLTLNGDTGSNYAWHQLYGDGVSPGVGAGTTQTSIRAIHSDATANVFGVGIIDILDYSNTNKYKTTRTLAGYDDNIATIGYVLFRSGLWQNTAAITSVTLTPNSGTFAQYSSFALYGIKGA